MARPKKTDTSAAPEAAAAETKPEKVEYAPNFAGEHGFSGNPRPGEPKPEDDRGEISRNVVEFRKKEWAKDQFNEVYPAPRLYAAGLADLID